jgi:hypothetical protein
MTRYWFAVICCVAVVVPSIVAQSPNPKTSADRISGAWAGDLVWADKSRTVPVTMELKFDGKNAVTGTVSGMPNPADVKIGTFDPKKGALKLQIGRKTDPAVLLVLEGIMAKGTVTGKFTGDESGTFTITKKP